MLVLRELEHEDESAFLRGLDDWRGESPHWHSFIWGSGVTWSEMLERLRKDRLGIDLPPDRVPHSMLYAFVGGEIVGRLSVRHHLNAYLAERGGHVGYAVAPRFRGRGYGSEIMRLGLAYCRSLGLERILVTCSDANGPSWRIIEKFGGRLQDRIRDDAANELVRRYWLEL